MRAAANSSRQTARYGAVQGHSCAAIITEAKESAKPLVTLADADVTVARGKTPGTAAPVCEDATGEPCDGCSEPIDAPGYALQGESTGADPWRFHVKCFYVWDELRRSIAGDRPGH